MTCDVWPYRRFLTSTKDFDFCTQWSVSNINYKVWALIMELLCLKDFRLWPLVNSKDFWPQQQCALELIKEDPTAHEQFIKVFQSYRSSKYSHTSTSGNLKWPLTATTAVVFALAKMDSHTTYDVHAEFDFGV